MRIDASMCLYRVTLLPAVVKYRRAYQEQKPQCHSPGIVYACQNVRAAILVTSADSASNDDTRDDKDQGVGKVFHHLPALSTTLMCKCTYKLPIG